MSLHETTLAIEKLLAQLPSEIKSDEKERAALLSACDQLRERLETPIEAVTKLIFSPHKTAAVNICIDAGLFDATANFSGSHHSLSALASQIGMDPVLLRRLLRLLVHEGMFREESAGTYTALAPARLFQKGSPFAAAMRHFEVDAQVVSTLPAYFAERGYKNPADAHNGPFQYATGATQHYFAWLGQRPAEQAAFNTVMQFSMRNRGADWFTVYPVNERLGSHGGLADSSAPLIVDIGGGVGHDLAAFAKRFPDLPGQLVLQDLPPVIAGIPADPPLPSRIKAVAHDMFSPQPYKGAAAYYMRTVLHDWPDAEALKILRNVVDAMTEHSVLLVSEKVMPEIGAPLSLVEADLSMMVQFASLERTTNQWKSLFEAAGLVLTGTWEPDVGTYSGRTLFEMRLNGASISVRGYA